MLPELPALARAVGAACGVVVLLLLAAYPLSLLQLAMVTLVGSAVELLGSAEFVDRLIPALPVDPVYGSIAAELLTAIDVQGVVIGGVLGEGLHALLPGVFWDPAVLSPGHSFDLVVAAGTATTTRFLVLALVDACLIAVGTALARAEAGGAARWERRALRWSGLVVQAHGLGSLVAQVLIPPDYEQMGLAPVANKLFGATSREEYAQLAALLVPVVRVAVPSTFILSTFGLFLLLPRIGREFVRLSAEFVPCRVEPRVCGGSRGRLPVAIGLGLLQAAVLWLGVAAHGGIVSDLAVAATPEPDPAPVGGAHTPINLGPESPPIASNREQGRQPLGRPSTTVVRIDGHNYRYRFVVNGEARVVEGVGYNPRYANLPAAARRSLYDRDFAQMRGLGVDVIQGWDPAEFDQVLLDSALAQGLGVSVPFVLPVDADYADPELQRFITFEVAQRLQAYKNHPAVWMWGLGNEVIHGIKSKDRARRFATFYVDLADYVHALDPAHPVFYRDAEDVFVDPLRDAFRAKQDDRRWFVYGINIFTPRIEAVVNGWENRKFDVPVVISEFAPTGYPPAERPKGYRSMWRVIRSRPDCVLGGFFYVWFRDGPDSLDPLYGLVDQEGRPVDGSAAAIGQLLESEAP